MPSTDTPDESAAAKAVRLLGGPVKAAVTLDVPDHRYQTVQSWVKTQVPAVYCPRIVALLPEMKLWDLRPDDWYRYWPSLIGSKGAPHVEGFVPVPHPMRRSGDLKAA